MAHVQDRGKAVNPANRWQARYRDPSGKERSKTFPRKLDAQRWLNEKTRSIDTGQYIDPNAGRVTLARFADGWLDAQTFDASTRETVESRIRTHIKPHLGAVELRNLRPSTVQAWVRGRQTEVAPSYCRLLLANLSTILSAAVEDGLIPQNPCASSSVRAPKAERGRVVPWTAERVQAITQAHPRRYRAAPVVGAGCGLRQGEVLGLTVDAVDFLRRTVHIRQQVRVIGRELVYAPPKGGKEREVPLPDVVAVAIAEQLRLAPAVDVTLPWREPGGQPRTSALIFTTRDGGAMTRAYYTHNAWKPAAKAAGVTAGRRDGFHALRHYFASALLHGGVSIRAVAEYLGHHDPGFTLRTYAHLMPESEDRARTAIDAALGAPAEPTRNAAEAAT